MTTLHIWCVRYGGMSHTTASSALLPRQRSSFLPGSLLLLFVPWSWVLPLTRFHSCTCLPDRPLIHPPQV